MPTSTTGDHLGPGCYSTSTKWIKSKPSLAPFLSTSGRNNDPQNLVTPGPGLQFKGRSRIEAKK